MTLSTARQPFSLQALASAGRSLMSISPPFLATALLVGAVTATQADEVLIQPGASLAAALEITVNEHRFGLDGAPPGPRGFVPVAPDAPGQHWLALYADDGRVRRWLPFVVAGEATAERTVALIIDREPPAASIQFAGATVDRPDGVVLGLETETLLTGSDRSGGVDLVLLVDGQPASDPWQHDLADGSYTLSLQARDALGNEGRRSEVRVLLDSTPPALGWEQLERVDGVPADVYDGRRATVRIALSDAGAGLQSARIGAQTLDAAQLAAAGIEIDIRGEALDYELADKVGNRSSGSIALRADREGPRLVARRDGERVEIGQGALSVRNRLTLDAEDALSGVERACVEATIWYGECRTLPVDLIGISPGNYSLRLRAVDRLGNRSKLKWTLEVTP